MHKLWSFKLSACTAQWLVDNFTLCRCSLHTISFRAYSEHQAALDLRSSANGEETEHFDGARSALVSSLDRIDNSSRSPFRAAATAVLDARPKNGHRGDRFVERRPEERCAKVSHHERSSRILGNDPSHPNISLSLYAVARSHREGPGFVISAFHCRCMPLHTATARARAVAAVQQGCLRLRWVRRNESAAGPMAAPRRCRKMKTSAPPKTRAAVSTRRDNYDERRDIRLRGLRHVKLPSCLKTAVGD
jgi:hypothetical protein